jgi:hypothetical protein
MPSLVLQPPVSPSVMKRPMKLVDQHTGKMECQMCGSEHYASIKPRSNGRYYPGSWQCCDRNCPSKQE